MPELPDIIRVSPHLLMDVVSCGTKGWVRHVSGMTSAGEAMRALAGQAFHAGVAEYLRPGNNFERAIALEAFHKVYDEPFKALSAEQLDAAYTPANLHRVIARWMEMHPPAMLPWNRVVCVEEAFVSREWSVRDSQNDRLVRVQLIVRPDAIVEDKEGFYRFVDTKTTGWHITDAGWRTALRLSLQVQLYADAVACKYGTQAKYAGWISAVEIRQLPSDPNRSCSKHKGLKYSECGNEHAKAEYIECMTTEARVYRAVQDAKAASQVFANLIAVEDGIEGIDMNGAANGTCRFCPASEWCETGRPVQGLKTWRNMMYDPYPVEVGQR